MQLIQRMSGKISIVLFAIGVLSGCGSTSGKVNDLVEEGKHQKAIKKANEYLKDEPRNKLLYYNRAKAKRGLGRQEEAIEDFQKALEMARNSEDWSRWPMYQIGQIKMSQGNYKQAEKKFTEALSIRSNWPEGLETRAEAREKMGNNAAARQDRKKAREIRVERDRKEGMEAWKNLTGGAPVKEYEPPIRGVSGANRRTHPDPFNPTNVNTTNYQCKGDSLASAREKFSDLGGEVVNKSDAGYYDANDNPTKQIFVTWKFTWWFESHPNHKFDYHRKYLFWECPSKENKYFVVRLKNTWGHIPGGYYSSYYVMFDGWTPQYSENDIFPGHAPEYIKK